MTVESKMFAKRRTGKTMKDMERFFVERTSLSPTFADHGLRSLGAGGAVRREGRGNRAPFATYEEAAKIVIGLGAADVPSRAAKLLPLFFDLPAVTPFNDHQTFGAAMIAVLASRECAVRIEEILIYRCAPRAIIRTKELAAVYASNDRELASALIRRLSQSGEVFRLSAGFIHQLYIELDEDPDEKTAHIVADGEPWYDTEKWELS